MLLVLSNVELRRVSGPEVLGLLLFGVGCCRGGIGVVRGGNGGGGDDSRGGRDGAFGACLTCDCVSKSERMYSNATVFLRENLTFDRYSEIKFSQ